MACYIGSSKFRTRSSKVSSTKYCPTFLADKGVCSSEHFTRAIATLLIIYPAVCVAVVLKTETAGKAAIGGPFELIDQSGKAFTDKDLLGKFALVYFGFTYCPDICPDELEKMTAAIDEVGMQPRPPPSQSPYIQHAWLQMLCSLTTTSCYAEKQTGLQVQPVFISIDPERDSVKQVSSYVSEFHPRLIGLTGPLDKVKCCAFDVTELDMDRGGY